MRLILIALLLLAPIGAFAQSCPQPLASARRLVLVTADDMNSPAARLQRVARANTNAPWRPDGAPASALIGRNGIGWGYPFRAFARLGEPVKVEGEKRAPAGIYAIGHPFGFAPSPRPGYLPIREGMVCVDDVRSGAYNTIVSRAQVSPQVHGDNMARVPEYRRGLLVDYPSSRGARGGSCIFIHLWLPNKTGTAGCVALREPQLAQLQDFAQGGAVLAIVPRGALNRFGGCLPSLN
jgi:L,D-peptidoglycan transpeptidase YkuD (ErfK/YbiS/YcfS/YnhG family)